MKEREKKMASKSVMSLICVVIVMAMVSSLATAIPIEVGTGQNAAGLHIEWADGYMADFLVRFDTTSISGVSLLDMVESQGILTTDRLFFGSAVFINGITYDGHSDVGYTGGENWWHYWIKNDGQDWLSPAYGASDRILYSGDMDGWVYGRAGITPEPASIILLTIGGMLIGRRSVRKS